MAWYPFDDRSGAVLRDRSGKGNHGTLYGPTWVAGRRGSALSFDGANDYVNVPQLDSLTLACWIYVTDFSGNSPIVIHGKETGGLRRMGIIAQADIYFSFFTSSTGGWQGGNYVVSSFHPSLNTWYFVVAVYDDVYNRLYINGILDASIDRQYDGLFATSETPKIGAGEWSDAQGYFSGIIDEVRIYNRALNAAEIKRHCESELMLVRH